MIDSGILSDILSHINFDILFDILSDICPGILSDNLSDTKDLAIYVAVYLHSIWHPFRVFRADAKVLAVGRSGGSWRGMFCVCSKSRDPRPWQLEKNATAMQGEVT